MLSRSAPPPRLLNTIMALTACAVGAFAVSLRPRPPHLTADHAVLAGLLLGMLVLARMFPVQLASKTKVTVSTAPLFASTLLLPAPLALVLAALSIVLGSLTGRRTRPWFQTLFNTAEVTLRVAVGAAVFHAIAGPADLETLAPGPWLAALPLVAVCMYLTNGLLVDLVIGIQLRRSPLHDFWRRRQFDLPTEISMFLLGLLVAGIAVRFPWAMVLLIVPSFVVYRSLRDGVALKVQTRYAIEQLADIVDMRDHYTFEHSRRVANLARLTAEAVGMSRDQVDVVEMAGRVHDVGKIGIKSTVLMKPDKLTDPEWLEMRSHPEIGARIVAAFPEFARGKELILSHHERYDGKGYPRGLAGEHIPLGARVMTVADAWDAMTSNRAYRRALDMEHVFGELQRGRGTQFDPMVLDAFLRVLTAHPELAVPQVTETQCIDAPLAPPAIA